MTMLLASVKEISEVKKILDTNFDIIDFKNPSDGILGAWNLEAIHRAIKLISGKKITSATVGNVPMEAHKIYKTLETFSATGVDYIKIGFMPSVNLENILKALPDLKRLNAKVIAVFFADYGLNISLINDLLCSQFSGIMLDTAKKDSGSLIDFLDIKTLKNFVRIAEKRGVLSGLAGSLKIENISTLLDLYPDVMGFRGVLCGNEGREGDICAESLSGFHKIFCDLNKSKPKSTTAIADAQLATS